MLEFAGFHARLCRTLLTQMSEFALAPFEAGHPCSRASPVLPWAGRSRLLETGTGYVRSVERTPRPAATSAHRRKVWETVPASPASAGSLVTVNVLLDATPAWQAFTSARRLGQAAGAGCLCRSPSWPPLLVPQQYARSSLVTPQVCSTPPLIRVITRSVRSLVGVERLVVVPSPNWPRLLKPQQSPSRESDAAGMVPARVHVAELDECPPRLEVAGERLLSCRRRAARGRRNPGGSPASPWSRRRCTRSPRRSAGSSARR